MFANPFQHTLKWQQCKDNVFCYTGIYHFKILFLCFFAVSQLRNQGIYIGSTQDYSNTLPSKQQK